MVVVWATKAFKKGIISKRESFVPLKFGNADEYEKAIHHFGIGCNDFYRPETCQVYLCTSRICAGMRALPPVSIQQGQGFLSV